MKTKAEVGDKIVVTDKKFSKDCNGKEDFLLYDIGDVLTVTEIITSFGYQTTIEADNIFLLFEEEFEVIVEQ